MNRLPIVEHPHPEIGEMNSQRRVPLSSEAMPRGDAGVPHNLAGRLESADGHPIRLPTAHLEHGPLLPWQGAARRT